MKRITAFSCATLIVTLAVWHHDGAIAFQGLGDTSHAPVGITAQGHLLWNLEALLVRSFGSHHVYATGSLATGWNFSCKNDCSPASRYTSYIFVFSRPVDSIFHISSRNMRSADFGPYAVPVLIRGRTIACDVREKRFLVAYGDTVSLSLGCVGPVPK